jgi:hypothetical protein
MARVCDLASFGPTHTVDAGREGFLHLVRQQQRRDSTTVPGVLISEHLSQHLSGIGSVRSHGGAGIFFHRAVGRRFGNGLHLSED